MIPFTRGDKTKYNDVYSFAIIPNLSLFEIYVQVIRQSLPKDFKKTTKLSPKNIDCLKNLPYLAINFIIPADSRSALKRKNDKIEFENMENNALSMFELWIQNNPENIETYEEHIKQYKLLLTQSKRNNFNLSLYVRSFFTATVAAYITHAVEKYSNAIGIVWGSDRDAMLSSNNQIIIDNYSIQHNGFARNDSEWIYNENCKIGFMQPDTEAYNWYDELIRIPDFCAGALASYSFVEDADLPARIPEPTENTYHAGRLEYIVALEGL